MSTTRKPAGRPQPKTGAARFEAVAPPPKKSAGESLLAAIALGALLFGVPALLWLLDGPPPIPTSSDFDALTGTISTEQVLSVLVGVVWLAWLHFALCTVVEILAAVRGGALAPRVPLGGASQRLARALVAAMLLSTGIASQASAMVAPPSAGVVASQTVHAAVAGENADTVGGVAHQEAPHAPGQSAEDRALSGRKVYTVKPPQGHHHDSLWDIAEQHLGDGRRYKEIFQLNQGREQPDGRQLELARLIQPGWHLVMPEDAVGVPRWQATPAPAAPVPTQQGGGSQAEAGGGDAGAGAVQQAEVQHADDAGFVQQATDPRSLAGAALLAVGLIAALRRARRRGRAGLADAEAVETEVWLRVGADEERAKRLTAALRGLAALCEEAGHPVPQAYAAAVDADTVELYLAPAAPEAPAPWSAVEDGRRWRLERASAPRRAQPGVVPFPALVSVGRDMAGRDILVNLAAAAGAISVTGSPAPSGHVVRALAAELATNAWSDQVRVIGVELPPELDTLGSDRLVRVDDAAQALALVDGSGPSGLGTDQVVSGRRGLAADGEQVDVVLLGRAVDGAESGAADRLRSIAASAGGSMAVVAAGAIEGARWNLLVDDAGSLHVDALGLTVTANRIDDSTLAALSELFTAAAGDAPTDPGAAADRPEIPAPPHTSDDGGWATAKARVGMLGPVLVRAPGPIDPSRVDLAAEVVAVLAVHPMGVHPNVLGGAVWPRGVTTEVRDATIARVRDWLGQDETGAYRLQQDRLGRLSLSPDVLSDWHVFCSLASLSRRAANPTQERDLLVRALRLVRGQLAADAAPGRYAWMARTGLEFTVPAVVVDASHRLVELLYNDDPGGAAEAARCGLRADPAAQLLWRDLLWAESAQWGPDGVRSTVGEMAVVLREMGVDMEAETGAVIEELLPGGPVAAATV
jgi:hypothetical protein